MWLNNVESIISGVSVCSGSEETLSKGVKQMEAGINRIKSEIKQHQKPTDRNDKFADEMKEFIQKGEEKFKKLQDQYQHMEKKCEDLAKFFVFDRKKVTMEEFFGDINFFMKDFEVNLLNFCACIVISLHTNQRARKENAKIREQLERQRLAKEREVCTSGCVMSCEHV